MQPWTGTAHFALCIRAEVDSLDGCAIEFMQPLQHDGHGMLGYSHSSPRNENI